MQRKKWKHYLERNNMINNQVGLYVRSRFCDIY